MPDRAWPTVNFSPQTHWLGKPDKGKLYRKRRESLNSCLFRTRPWSTRGTAVSHELALLSLDWLTNCNTSGKRVASILSFLDFADAILTVWRCLLSSSVDFSPATIKMLCVAIDSTCDAVIDAEAANSVSPTLLVPEKEWRADAVCKEGAPFDQTIGHQSPLGLDLRTLQKILLYAWNR